MRILLSIIFLTSFLLSIRAQSSMLGLMPSVTMSAKLKNDWKLITKLEERSFLHFGNDQFDISHHLLDLNTFISKKVGLNVSLATGLQLRYKDKGLISSLAQQLTAKDKYGRYDVSHRFGADIVLFDGQDYKARGRYRFAGLIPFSGLTIDVLEWYAKPSVEGLLVFTRGAISSEYRLALLIGKGLGEGLKLEVGPEFRQKIKDDSLLWSKVSLYKSF